MQCPVCGKKFVERLHIGFPAGQKNGWSESRTLGYSFRHETFADETYCVQLNPIKPLTLGSAVRMGFNASHVVSIDSPSD